VYFRFIKNSHMCIEFQYIPVVSLSETETSYRDNRRKDHNSEYLRETKGKIKLNHFPD